jgi:adenine-specific DNA-methyltransferase
VGIENHVNYIHKPGGTLSVYEAFGIASLLNTTIIDKFFRSLNGNTQVNATDIRSLPLPDIENIRKIGKAVYESKSYKNGIDLDGIISGILGLNIDNIAWETEVWIENNPDHMIHFNGGEKWLIY